MTPHVRPARRCRPSIVLAVGTCAVRRVMVQWCFGGCSRAMSSVGQTRTTVVRRRSTLPSPTRGLSLASPTPLPARTARWEGRFSLADQPIIQSRYDPTIKARSYNQGKSGLAFNTSSSTLQCDSGRKRPGVDT